MTTTSHDTTLDESLDFEFEPPCEYAWRSPDCTEVAVWAVWTDSLPCGDDPRRFRLFCDACWTYRNHTGLIFCRSGHRYPAQDNILSVERIKK